MGPEDLYPDHVRVRRERAERALAATGFDTLLVSSGTPHTYFADDQEAPHHETPHFAHWLPLTGLGHVLRVRPGERPRVVRLAPEDFWYEKAPLGDPFWAEAFDVREAATPDEVRELVEPAGRVAFVGPGADAARARGVAPDGVNPPELVARLDWDRSFKTPYEVACLEVAQATAARGHRAAREAFDSGASELQIHHAYVEAVGCVDEDLPYPSIVGLDEKGAILHYTGKRRTRGGKVLLIDAGARHLGYASDVTRTWTAEGCEPVFHDLVLALDAAQQEMCAAVRPGLPYGELHRLAHARIGTLLHEAGVLALGGDEAVELGLTLPFFPHGLGHFLGLQVHDVAGRQAAPEGGTVDPPPEYPALRTTRTIEEGQVFTVEPGIYFIEMLLRGHRGGPASEHFDWDLVERLKPCGGVRIEDDVLVTAGGHRNLTRPHV